jgi:hypothetical protein
MMGKAGRMTRACQSEFWRLTPCSSFSLARGLIYEILLGQEAWCPPLRHNLRCWPAGILMLSAPGVCRQILQGSQKQKTPGKDRDCEPNLKEPWSLLAMLGHDTEQSTSLPFKGRQKEYKGGNSGA